MSLSFGSVCSGIEAATVAWRPLGWRAAWLAEVAPFPSAVLASHYPDTLNLGDMTALAARVEAGEIDAPDVLTGGTPCQAFSVAGLRKGLTDARGQLSLTFCQLADAIDRKRAEDGRPPCIAVWENVPGVLSSKDNAFGCFLAGLAGEGVALEPPGGKWANAGAVLGPARAVCWRVLDAQYFGVAQRRRRVWVVASARTDFDPLSVLLECEGLRRDTAPSRETGEGITYPVAPCLDRSGTGFSRTGDIRGQDPVVACFGGNRTSGSIDVAPALLAQPGSGWKGDFESEAFCVTGDRTHALTTRSAAGEDGTGQGVPIVPTCVTGDRTHALKAEGADGSEDGMGRGAPIVACREIAAALTSNYGKQVDNSDTALGPNIVAFHHNAQACQLPSAARDTGVSDALTRSQGAAVAGRGAVRRLTPVECERLQGFPDNYTLIPWRKKLAGECPDGPRYAALGNSWAVPCARWIGRRIHQALALDPTA